MATLVQRNDLSIYTYSVLPLPEECGKDPHIFVEVAMPSRVCEEVRGFVSACEAVHALLAGGGVLTHEGRDLIEFSAIELLSKVKPK
jgi:hypothetical protein